MTTINPCTGRKIKIGGSIYNSLVRNGLIHVEPYYNPLNIQEMLEQIMTHCDINTSIALSNACHSIQKLARNTLTLKIVGVKMPDDIYVINKITELKERPDDLKRFVKTVIHLYPMMAHWFVKCVSLSDQFYITEIANKQTPRPVGIMIDYTDRISSTKVISLMKKLLTPVCLLQLNLITYDSDEHMKLIFSPYLDLAKMHGVEPTIPNLAQILFPIGMPAAVQLYPDLLVTL